MKNILITGVPGVGKTTLTKKIVEKLKNLGISVDGFYTEEVRNERRQRIGFDIVTISDGRKTTLADKRYGLSCVCFGEYPLNFREVSSSPNIRKLGQYTVYIKNIEEFAVPIISNSNQNKKIIVIDEVGKMELFSKKFQETVKTLVEDINTTIIATVPVKGPPFVNDLKQDKSCQIFEVTEISRNYVIDEIIQVLTETSLSM